ncbi:unnamed protein product [Caenorhabditis auriculariae]|uniref:Secreted protein n=1 Tax=Caenorhabditis auriculariae TaxID=2777116 RepID=A0A8S1GMA5_9PELO|nr:unnamed protein product [Caenorhabditis auriculariae]
MSIAGGVALLLLVFHFTHQTECALFFTFSCWNPSQDRNPEDFGLRGPTRVRRQHHYKHHSVPSSLNCTSYTYHTCPKDRGCQSVIRRKGGEVLYKRCEFLSKAALNL